jgi:DNA-binding response OmpR family regulator
MRRVLVIEDDKDIVELVRYNLEKTATRWRRAGTVPAVFRKFGNRRPIF